MDRKNTEEFQLRLKAPMIALERVYAGKYLPKVFVHAALEELSKAQKLANRLKIRKGNRV